MEIQMINLGRNKVNKTVTVKDEKAMWRELGKHLASKSIELQRVENDPERYDVYVGVFRNVGQVIIK